MLTPDRVLVPGYRVADPLDGMPVHFWSYTHNRITLSLNNPTPWNHHTLWGRKNVTQSFILLQSSQPFKKRCVFGLCADMTMTGCFNTRAKQSMKLFNNFLKSYRNILQNHKLNFDSHDLAPIGMWVVLMRKMMTSPNVWRVKLGRKNAMVC